MIAMPPQQRAALMLTASVVGVAASWLTMTPFGLLAPIAALFFYTHRRAVPLFLATLGIALAGSMLAALFFSDGMRDLALSWAAFFAVALCIGAVVVASMSATFDADATGAVMRSTAGEGTSPRADKWPEEITGSAYEEEPAPDGRQSLSGKKTEEALRARERQLSQLVDLVPSHLWRLTPEGELTFFNKRMVDFLGMDVADTDKPGMSKLAGATQTLTPPDDAASLREAIHHCVVTGERFFLRHRMRRADGVYRWMDARAEPLRDEGGRIVQWYGVTVDVDDEVRAQQALRRAHHRLAQAAQTTSLAELFAWLAHEVNQPLAAIVASSHACHHWLSADPPNVERAKVTIERVIRSAGSAADIIGRIRAPFRPAPQDRSSEDVNHLIGEVCQLMADEIAEKDVEIRTNLDLDLPSIALDRIQVQQVLMNLIRNGIEAMNAVDDGSRALQIRSCRDGSDAIRVEVRDAGKGFKDGERAFEPFFTTKQQGMGMGLSICRSIIDSHGGRLWTADNETRGATVAFTLPLAGSDAP